MDRRILENLLDKLGIDVSKKGYTYLTDLVEMYLRDIGRPEPEKRSLEKYYKEIAIVYSTAPLSVERCIRYAYQRCINIIQKYFNISYSINTRRLLELIAREMRRMQNEY